MSGTTYVYVTVHRGLFNDTTMSGTTYMCVTVHRGLPDVNPIPTNLFKGVGKMASQNYCIP